MDGGNAIANLKRESRAYSYEDQKWELQVKREKRKRLLSDSQDIHSLLKASSLTAKQRTLIEEQLQLEDNIRKRLSAEEKKLNAVRILVNMLCDHVEFVPLLPSLVAPVLKSLKLPLASDQCLRMWKSMCEAALGKNTRRGEGCVH